MSDSDIVRSGVLGLAAGDALSWLAADHREYLLPTRRMGVLRTLDAHADATGTTTRPRPHVHSSPASTLRPGPGDDLEWFVVTARALTAGEDAVVPAWQALLSERPRIRARVSVVMALDNLARGLMPPASGHDNAHYFDDIACVRAVAAGLIGGDETDAARLAELDASVTHSLDGVWCARATAALVAGLSRGAETHDAVAGALAQLPGGSWSHRLAGQALALAPASTSALDLAMRLDTELVDKIYSYGVSAPETLAILLAHTWRAGSAEELMLGAFGHGRNADALPALAGAVAALRWGSAWVPSGVSDGTVLDGVCVPSLSGVRVDDVILDLGRARSSRA